MRYLALAALFAAVVAARSLAQPDQWYARADDPHAYRAMLVATMIDSAHVDGVAENYSATIDWGDGKTSPGTVTGSYADSYQVFGSHQFRNAGRYTVIATITENKNSDYSLVRLYSLDVYR